MEPILQPRQTRDSLNAGRAPRVKAQPHPGHCGHLSETSKLEVTEGLGFSSKILENSLGLSCHCWDLWIDHMDLVHFVIIVCSSKEKM